MQQDVSVTNKKQPVSELINCFVVQGNKISSDYWEIIYNWKVVVNQAIKVIKMASLIIAPIINFARQEL